MKAADMELVLLRASEFDGRVGEGGITPPRTVYDYELELYTSGGGGISYNGEFVKFDAGDIGVRCPGQQVYGILPYYCILIALDLYGGRSKRAGYALGCEEGAQPADDINIVSALPRRIPAGKGAVAAGLIETIKETALFTTELHELRLRSLLYQLVAELASSAGAGRQRPLGDLLRYINVNFTASISVESLIEVSGMSRGSFHRAFQTRTGMTPGAYITMLRMEKAKSCLPLLGNKVKISDVAQSCGYLDAAYFTYAFRRYTGMTPGEYVKNTGHGEL